MRRVLVIRFSALGDIILTFPSLDHLVDSGAEVHFLTKKAFVPLLETYGRVAQIHSIPDHATFSDLLAKVRELRALGFDAVYDLHRNLRSRIALIGLKANFQRISKFRFKEFFLYVFRRGFFQIVFQKPIVRSLEALQVVGGRELRPEKRLRKISLDLLEHDLRTTLGKFRDGYVCISVESAWQQKEWGLDRFIEVAKALATPDRAVVWLGLKKLPPEAQLAHSIDITRKLTLPQVAAVLSGARVLVCNDSGLMHLAEAAGTPVVALFGPTSRELGFAPLLEKSKIVEADLWCRPCSKTGRFCIRPIERRKCLSAIKPEQALRAVQETLKG